MGHLHLYMSDSPAPWNPNQDEADRLLDEADLASEAEDWKRCEALCRQALALVPDDERACTDLGLVLMEQEQFRKAHVYLSTAASSNPTAPIFCLLAHCAIELGRPSECQGLLVQALEVDPDYDEAHCNLGAVLADTDPELARSHFRKALELDPLLTAPLIGLARLSRDAGDFEQAIAYAEQAEGIEPDDVQVQELLGQTRYASLIHNKQARSDAEHEQCFAATEAALLRAAALDERSPITCSYLGMLHQHFGQQEQAEVWFRKGGELDDIGIFSSLLGEYLADQGRYAEADAFMEQVVERFP
ncbi:MAG: tetratricopeptide repeat protein, partial [Planctomycetota bacterium]|nr:tetratricopeptide repeat protein [Planctomycetota bacterium]